VKPPQQPQRPAPQPAQHKPSPVASAPPKRAAAPRVADVLGSALVIQRTPDGTQWTVTLRQQLVGGGEYVEGGKAMPRRFALVEYARLQKRITDTITRWGGTPNG